MIDLISAALEARLQLLTGETIAWWGRPFTPVKGQPYLAVKNAGRASNPMGYGASAPELWQGTLQLLVVHPMLEGLRPAEQRARAARDHFPRGLTLDAGGARVCIETRTIQPAYEQPDWLNVPVLIGWFTEENPA